MTKDELRTLIRTVPDFPTKGIAFRDITTLLADGAGFARTVEALARDAHSHDAQAVVGMEARGFIFGAAVAARLGLPFVPIRKPGKLPVPTIGVDYSLEYGNDRLELDPSCIAAERRIVVIDDLIATGGTAQAAIQLLRQAGARIDAALFVIGLPDLGGIRRLMDDGVVVSTLIDYKSG
ncbi:MAG: adenine phosphoribosyltransferase [Pontixanthobacter sp.]